MITESEKPKKLSYGIIIRFIDNHGDCCWIGGMREFLVVPGPIYKVFLTGIKDREASISV